MFSKIYPCSLESLEIFQGFTDFCRTFELYRGKTKLDEENEIVGEFKGFFRVYHLTDDNTNLPAIANQSTSFPSSQVEECLIRIYVIRAFDLQPKDSNGKSDPYIEIQLGKTKIDNRDERIPNTTDPIFGKFVKICFVIR